MNIIDIIKKEYPIKGYQKTADYLGLSLYNLKKIIRDNNILLDTKKGELNFLTLKPSIKKKLHIF